MIELPNPFTDPAAIPYPAAGQAVAFHQPRDATADPLPSNQGGNQGASAVMASNPATAGATDLLGSPIGDVGELFHFARMLCAEARINPGTISPEAVAVAEEIKAYEEQYDPPPLFLRRTG